MTQTRTVYKTKTMYLCREQDGGFRGKSRGLPESSLELYSIECTLELPMFDIDVHNLRSGHTRIPSIALCVILVLNPVLNHPGSPSVSREFTS
jgi:hypothetical protein